MSPQRLIKSGISLMMLLSMAIFPFHDASATAGVYINEIQVSTSGTDWEFVELQGVPDTDLSDLTLIGVESDLGGNAGVIDLVISLAGQSIPSDGYWLAMSPAGTVAYGVTGQLVIADNSLENSTATYFLVQGFMGALGEDLDVDDDGAVDLTPWSAVLDSINIRDADAGDFSYGAPSVGPDGPYLPSGTYRCPDAPSGMFDSNMHTFDAPNGTPGTSNALTCGLTAVYINEIQVSSTGTDWEFVELQGAPGTDLSWLTLVGIESDAEAASGTIDVAISLVGQSIPADGFWLGTSPTAEVAYGVTGDLQFEDNSFENSTATYFLVQGFMGALGEDLDVDDDGALDLTPWSAVFDSINIRDAGAGDFSYGAPSIGPDGPYLPSGTYRCPDAPDGPFGPIHDFYAANGTPGAANLCEPEACGSAATAIYAVQGAGAASPLEGAEVAVEGIVVGDFQNNGAPDNGHLDGFFVQDVPGDGDPSTSDGIFVFAPSSIDVSLGDTVRVRGTVAEYMTMTEITADQVWQCSTGNPLPQPAQLSLPVDDVADFEALEGMRVAITQDMYISGHADFDRYGEIVLASERLMQPTAIFDPGSLEAAALAELNAASRILLDDGRNFQNPDPAIHPNGSVFDLDNLFRAGDVVQDVTGVLEFRFGNYRIQPTQGADYLAVNLRTAEPDDTGGSIKIASFNVLNYFNGDGMGGGFPTSRGADDSGEFVRQRDKIISAIAAMDADVIGVVEIENDGYDEYSAIQDLVNGLNDATSAGTYGFVDPGVPVIGTDEIAVGLLYKPGSVALQGGSAILDSTVDSRFIDTLNRPALAQTFVSVATGGVFTVVVNHLKSKGSGCDAVGDPDTGDGAGNCNLTRTQAAEALVDWIASDPTGSNDEDYLVIGDLNSYAKEDPIDVFLQAGYFDLLAEFNGEHPYNYVFDAQAGYLDYALASPGLRDMVTGATAWHINADEPDLINYDTTFKQDSQDAIYAADAYASSDHDPVVVGLNPRYLFEGFYTPVKNPPATNKVKAGASVPIKFSLGGDYGLDVFADGFPVSQDLDCSTGLPNGTVETETAGGSMLYYDPYTDQYVYVWKTKSDWSGTCRRLVLRLADGTSHHADFKFK